MKKLMMIAAVCSALAASAEITITGVTARQRWPWNNLVDIDYTIQGAAAGEAFAIGVEAEWAGGAKKVVGTTFSSEPVASGSTNRITWDFGADCPNTVAADCRISVTATPISNDKAIYMVIDLSGGPTATKYPVRYTTTPPAHVQGAADEPCQTTELWMRRMIPYADAFTVGGWRSPASNNTIYYGKITKPYYIGVFELTQRQFNLITGEWPSYFANEAYRAARPLENVCFSKFCGINSDIDRDPSGITDGSPLGKLRAKTGLPLSLPTDIQWEFAARGGTSLAGGLEFTIYYVNGRYLDRSVIARYSGNTAGTANRDSDTTFGTATVGAYLPNDYGLYDMLGNVSECLSCFAVSTGSYRAYYQEQSGDDTLGMSKGNPIIDPKGTPQSMAYNNLSYFRRACGGAWAHSSDYISLWLRSSWESGDSSGGSDYFINKNKIYGFRLSMTVE